MSCLANPQRMPRIGPLPPSLVSDVEGTFAYDTMTRRCREEILKRVFDENDFSEVVDETERKRIFQKLVALDCEMKDAANTPLRHIMEDGLYDVAEWRITLESNNVIAKQLTWLTAPWIIAEFYFYRRILEATEYGRNAVDPFKRQKLSGLASSVGFMEKYAAEALSTLNALTKQNTELFRQAARTFVKGSLWGNQADLSLWPSKTDAQQPNSLTNSTETSSSDENHTKNTENGGTHGNKQKTLVSDYSASLMDTLVADYEEGYGGKTGDRRVDFFTDNAGFELFCDLILADFFVTSGIATRVVLRVKTLPVFVSDAMDSDVWDTINFLEKQCAEIKPLRECGERWRHYLENSRFILVNEPFAVCPTPFWDMPNALYEDLGGNCKLVVVKGDANYRRLLGDLTWAMTTPFDDIVCYFPTRLLALRTMKSEIGCGIAESTAKESAETDIRWSVNGTSGMIQFFNP